MKLGYYADYEDLDKLIQYIMIGCVILWVGFAIVSGCSIALGSGDVTGLSYGVMLVLIWLFIGGLIYGFMYLHGIWCFSIAYSKKRRHPNFAFIIGCLTGLFGVAIYYILDDKSDY